MDLISVHKALNIKLFVSCDKFHNLPLCNSLCIFINFPRIICNASPFLPHIVKLSNSPAFPVAIVISLPSKTLTNHKNFAALILKFSSRILVGLQATSRRKASKTKQAVQLTLLNGKNKRSRSTTQLGEPAVTKARHPSEYSGKLLWLRAPSFVATYAIQSARPPLNLGHRFNTGPQESTRKRSWFPNSK